MKANGPAAAITTATKILRSPGSSPVSSGATIGPVCVFGVLTPAGQIVEAHSLQPSDANSAAAVADAEQIDFSPQLSGMAAQQHFVFVVELFASAQ
jgi:hypothetical protein